MANKTVIQGLEPDASGSNNMGFDSQFYSRSTQQGTPYKGTVVEGMGGGYDPSANVGAQGGQHTAEARKAQPAAGRPIVGFLYSVSRTPAGEYWPLYIGQNTIGKSGNCHIVLPEATISSEHAVLVVRKMKNPEKVIASISDARSTNGTMLNGMSLAFAAEECHNGDILTIGNNYELMLILIDTAALGLHPAETFIPVEEEEDDSPFAGQDTGAYRRTSMDPSDSDAPHFMGGGSSYNGTVGLDGEATGHGGTVGM